MSIPPDDLPRIPPGLLPQWVFDEPDSPWNAPDPWGTTPSTPPTTGRRTPPGPRARPERLISEPPPRAPAPPARRGRGSAAVGWFAAVPLLVMGALIAHWVGQQPDGLAGALDALEQTADQVQLPPPPPGVRSAPVPSTEEAGSPLGVPPVPADPTAPHEFMNTLTRADGSVVPMTWSPCRPIHYVVDPAGAPPDFAVRVAGVMQELTAATGLVFVDDGTTTEPASQDRASFQPDLYGDRWAPALIRFADAAAIPEFDTQYVGLGGPAAAGASSDLTHYVSGYAYLDADLLQRPDVAGEPAYVPVLRHELGHLLGLAHVDDPAQLMYVGNHDVSTFQPGDLAGLAAAGGGACAPDL